MQTIRHLGLVLLAALALSAITASSASASPLFLYHGTGKPLFFADNVQAFTTTAGTIECKALKGTQSQPPLRYLFLLISFHFESCSAFGLAATVDLFAIVIHSTGVAFLEFPIIILVPSVGCTITYPTAANQNLHTIKFDNNANGSLLLLQSISHLTSFGKGVGCEFAEESNGTYSGTVGMRLHGGSLRWDP